MAKFLMISSVLIFGIILNNFYANGYNLDVVNYIRHEHRRDSMFGFTVALHKENSRSWVLVGAPKANTSKIQQNVIRGGAVYKCEIIDDDKCILIPFDKNSNIYNSYREQIDNKSYQWFGATLHSGGPNAAVVACAPRYVFYTTTPRKVERVEPVGTCYVAKRNFTEFIEYSPCRTSLWGYHRQGSCQAGFSASINDKGDRLFVGAPGSWYWQGQVYSINTNAVYRYKPYRYDKYGLYPEGQLYSKSLTDEHAKVFETDESSVYEDDSYLGYSSAPGYFFNQDEQGIAVGMPRGEFLKGKVVIMTWKLEMYQNITGQQIGEYFGYSIAVGDINGDGKDDLIVGAPMYSNEKNYEAYEMGRVFIFYQTKTYGNFHSTPDIRVGTQSKGRFGLSVCSLSDINMDNYGDFAVGAPYAGENGLGVVYIYHGSANGPLEKPSQIIKSEDVSGLRLSTFGFSLAGGVDLDNNSYPDLVVGAYESGVAVTFKSRVVVAVQATARFESDSKLISLENKNCVLPGENRNVSCIKVTYCLNYDGTSVPASIDVYVTLTLDSKSKHEPRLYFLNDRTSSDRNFTVTLYRRREACQSQSVFIKDEIRDKLTPLEVEIKYDLRSNQYQQESRKKRFLQGPVLDQNLGTSRRDTINIQKNCGPDNICYPNLHLDVISVSKYFLGLTTPLSFEVTITNSEEDAFEASFYMKIPKGFTYNKIVKIDKSETPLPICYPPSAETFDTLKCDLGNPLTRHNVATFKVLLQPTSINDFNSSNIVFYMEANSTNPEQKGKEFDNVIKKTIKINVQAELVIRGKSDPSAFHYNMTGYKEVADAKTEEDLGPQVTHLYHISNDGPATIEKAQVLVLWSHQTNNGDELMYLVSNAETYGNVKCDYHPEINKLNLKVNTLNKSMISNLGVEITDKTKSSYYYNIYGNVPSQFYGSGHSTGSINTSSSTGSFQITSTGSGYVSSMGKNLTEEELNEIYERDQNIESTGDGSFGRDSVYKTPFSTSYYNRTEIIYDGHGNVISRKEFHDKAGQGDSSDFYDYMHSGGSGGSSNMQGSQTNVQGSYVSGSQQHTTYDKGNYNENVNQDISNLNREINYGGKVSGSNAFEKAAQGTGGFHTTLLDLGMNTGDIDSDLHKQGQSQMHSSGSQQSGSGSSHSQSNFNYGGNTGGNGEFRKEYHYYSNQGGDGGSANSGSTSHTSQTYSSPTVYEEHYSSQSFSNNPHISKNFESGDNLQHYNRYKREIIDDNLTKYICNNTKCLALVCHIDNLAAKSDAYIALRLRVVMKTVQKIAGSSSLTMSTMAMGQITQLPHVGKPADIMAKNYEIFVEAIPEPEPKQDVVPLWVVVLSAVIGALILLMIIYLMYKCGFFKRNRPTGSPQERQPLNR